MAKIRVLQNIIDPNNHSYFESGIYDEGVVPQYVLDSGYTVVLPEEKVVTETAKAVSKVSVNIK